MQRNLKSLRDATEDDVLAALKDSYVTLPLSSPADALEFFNRMLDVLTDRSEHRQLDCDLT